jgi:hypothetical protein
LTPAWQVDDGETAHAGKERSLMVFAAIVGPPVNHFVEGGSQRPMDIGILGPPSCNSTHMLVFSISESAVKRNRISLD